MSGTIGERLVENPNGVKSVTLDGQPQQDNAIDLADDGRTHEVSVVGEDVFV